MASTIAIIIKHPFYTITMRLDVQNLSSTILYPVLNSLNYLASPCLVLHNSSKLFRVFLHPSTVLYDLGVAASNQNQSILHPSTSISYTVLMIHPISLFCTLLLFLPLSSFFLSLSLSFHCMKNCLQRCVILCL